MSAGRRLRRLAGGRPRRRQSSGGRPCRTAGPGACGRGAHSAGVSPYPPRLHFRCLSEVLEKSPQSSPQQTPADRSQHAVRASPRFGRASSAGDPKCSSSSDNHGLCERQQDPDDTAAEQPEEDVQGPGGNQPLSGTGRPPSPSPGWHRVDHGTPQPRRWFPASAGRGSCQYSTLTPRHRARHIGARQVHQARRRLPRGAHRASPDYRL